MTDYQLIDFGDQEKLERFAGQLVRRETPAAIGSKDLRLWAAQSGAGECDLCWTATDPPFGKWQGEAVQNWRAQIGTSVFLLRQTPSGQIGLFPEQIPNWQWIAGQGVSGGLSGLKAINLFGYTGGTTMALAAAGASVVHVDAAKSVVNWARENAAASGLANHPIRWIVEDAMRFIEREIKRGNRYEIVVADPPSFGRGPAGESWKIQRDLERLVHGLAELTAGGCRLLLLSCHTPEIGLADLQQSVQRNFQEVDLHLEQVLLKLTTVAGKSLPSGLCLRGSNLISR